MDTLIKFHFVIVFFIISIHTSTSFRDPTFPVYYKRYGRNVACPPSHPYRANGTCVNQCPEDLPLIVPNDYGFESKSYCTKHCPTSMYKNKNICKDTCEKDQLTIVDTKECHDGTTCPPSYPLNQTIYGTRSCSSRCPFLFIEDKTTNSCILFYMCKQKLYHSSCVERCPEFFYDSGPENLDKSESSNNALAENIFYNFRVCLSDYGYRVTALISFLLSVLILPSVLYFYCYERCCKIPKWKKGSVTHHRSSETTEDLDPVLFNDELETAV